MRRGPARVSIELPPAVALFAIGRGSSVAISPDARRIVYVAVAGNSTRLLTRSLDGLESTAIAGTDNATNPFFSPDGKWIGFWSSRSLKKVPAAGGVATTIVENASFLGASWADDDTIVYPNDPDGELWRVPSAGGTPPRRVTTKTNTGALHSWPQVLPGGRSVIYTIWNNTGFEGGRIIVQPLAGGTPAVVVEGGSHGRVVVHDGSAHLLFARADGLMAAPFDLEREQVSGPAVLVQPGVLTNLSGGAHFSVVNSGVLAYVPGGLDELNKTMMWAEHDGRTTELPPIAGMGFQYRLSPDGRRLARPNATGADRDLWIDDVTGRSASTRLTFDEVTNLPIWTHDGQRVIYTKSADGNENLFWRAADGSGDEERLTTSGNAQVAGSVTPDGTLVYQERDPQSGFDLWMLPLHNPREPMRFLSTPRNEGAPRTSPNGRWVAYQSNISGSVEVYIASFPRAANRVRVSRDGGMSPMWSPSGREVYFRGAPSQGGPMMAATVDVSGAEPQVGAPRMLFPGPFQGVGDVAPDGRFLLVRQTTRESATRVIQLVFDWFDELRTKVPPR